MAFFLRNNDDEVWEGNRHYRKITNLLQNDVKEVTVMFRLHRKAVGCSAFVNDDGFVYLLAYRLSRNDVYPYPNHLFDLRAGLVGEDLREIVAVKFDIDYIDKLIKHSELDSIRLSNKALYLFIEIKRKDENVQKIKDRKQQIETHYRDLLLSGKNSDLVLEVKHKTFYCHRCILAARSPVFADLMKNNMDEKGSGKVIVEDADPDVFQKFLLFLYTGKEDYLSWKNVRDLYKLADKYGVEEIKDVCRNDIKQNIDSFNLCVFFYFSLEQNDSELNTICRNAIKKNISTSNFCWLFNISQLRNDSELTKTIVHFFLRNSKDIVSHEYWMTFLSEDSKKWLSVDHMKDKITVENFFFFFKLSQIQNDSDLTEIAVQFFLKKSQEIIQSENWMTFLAENPVDANILIKAVINKKQCNMLCSCTELLF